jgi:photosystem II stability/assembly factor-like uncharacterized protein
MFSFGQWNPLPDYPGNEFVKASFTDANIGFAITYVPDSSGYYLAKTTNGAQSWNHLNFIVNSQADVVGIHFIHQDSGAIAYRKMATVGTRVLRTWDGGNSWTDVSPDSSNFGFGSFSLRMSDGKTIHFGCGSSYYRTTDGGASWDTTVLNGFNSLLCMDFADPSNGIQGFWDGTFLYSGGVYSTTDAGQNWDENFFGQAYRQVTQVSFPSLQEAYCISGIYDPMPLNLHRSTDGGYSWDTLHSLSLSWTWTSMRAREGIFYFQTERSFSVMMTGFHGTLTGNRIHST